MKKKIKFKIADENNVESKKKINWNLIIIAGIVGLMIIAMTILICFQIKNMGNEMLNSSNNSNTIGETTPIDEVNSVLNDLQKEGGAAINYDGIIYMIQNQIESKYQFVESNLGWDPAFYGNDADSIIKKIKSIEESFTDKDFDLTKTLDGKTYEELQKEYLMNLFENQQYSLNLIDETDVSLEEGEELITGYSKTLRTWMENGHKNIDLISEISLEIAPDGEDKETYDIYGVAAKATIKTRDGEKYLIPLASFSNGEGYNGYLVLDVIPI